MSAPSAMIDSNLSPANGVYWVLELASVWRTTVFGGGSAVWSEAYTATAFEAANGCTGCTFLRVVAPTDTLVYVLANALKTGDAQYSAWILVSYTQGYTWYAYKIEDGIVPRDYTVTYKLSGPQTWAGDAIQFVHTHTRIGDSESTFNPWAVARRITTNDTGSWDSLNGDANTIHDYSQSSVIENILWGTGNWLLGSGGAAGEVYLDDYFGVGLWTEESGINKNMPKEANRVYVKQTFEHSSNSYWAYAESWVFWNKPSPGMPKALAVAPSNNSWLYVGLNDKIKASEDGGVNWFNLYTGHGAYDICVDPQLGGAIYYWSTDGNLNLLVKSGLETEVLTLTSTGLMIEAPYDAFSRVDRDPSSGRLLALPGGASLKMRNVGSTTEIKTGLVSACGLHIYPGQKVIFVDDTKIYYCDNLYTSPPTINDGTGDWAAYADGVQAHRMISP